MVYYHLELLYQACGVCTSVFLQDQRPEMGGGDRAEAQTRCGIEEHIHTSACFSPVLICGHENAPGEALPSTGGMGTRLFYLFGSLLFLGAFVILISRRITRK